MASNGSLNILSRFWHHFPPFLDLPALSAVTSEEVFSVFAIDDFILIGLFNTTAVMLCYVSKFVSLDIFSCGVGDILFETLDSVVGVMYDRGETQ